nr:tRNA dimethylallyltransferase-like [Halyomorpha halys]
MKQRTGKSKLAIQIAKTFNGEVISADSMQLYRRACGEEERTLRQESVGERICSDIWSGSRSALVCFSSHPEVSDYVP